MKLPRIKPGHVFLGPELHGCTNTGMRPSIYHSKSGKWLVGSELFVREVLQHAGHFSNKRKHKFNTQTVYVFKGRGSAVKRFAALCVEVEIWNETAQKLHHE